MPGFGDIIKLMSHAKELQESAAKLKDELPNMEFTAAAANGGIQVTVGGDFTVRAIRIAPEMLGDRTYLEGELQGALNSAFASARSAMQEKMKEVTGALGIELPAF